MRQLKYIVKSSISDDESLGLEITGVKEGVKKIPKLIVCPTSEWMDQARMYVSKWSESTLVGSREDKSHPIEYLPPHHY